MIGTFEFILMFFVSVELETKEKEYERKLEKMKIDHDQEIFALKQENYVLSAKVTIPVFPYCSGFWDILPLLLV